MKVLVVGKNPNAYTMAKFLSEQKNVDLVFLTSGNNSVNDFATVVDIEENDVENLSEFVCENSIDFTIVMSEIAIINGIADCFSAKNLLIFAPKYDAAKITFFLSSIKKTLYKLKVQTPRFGIFDKENIAIDYARNSQYPLLLQNDFTILNHQKVFVKNFNNAKYEIQKLLENGNDKIVIENYLGLKELYVYYLTDGIEVLFLGSCNRHEDMDNIFVTSPDSFFSFEYAEKLKKYVIYPLLEEIKMYSDSYSGILGLKILTNNQKFWVCELYSSFQQSDFLAILPLIKTNFLDLMYSVAVGSLSDEYNYIEKKNLSTCTLLTEYVLLDYDNENIFLTPFKNNKYFLTSVASTLFYAIDNVKDYYSFSNQNLPIEISEYSNNVLELL